GADHPLGRPRDGRRRRLHGRVAWRGRHRRGRAALRGRPGRLRRAAAPALAVPAPVGRAVVRGTAHQAGGRGPGPPHRDRPGRRRDRRRPAARRAVPDPVRAGRRRLRAAARGPGPRRPLVPARRQPPLLERQSRLGPGADRRHRGPGHARPSSL
ncbi:MAG: Signal peptidase I, partial [uncultured Solirubrobacteraceae bacterium]